MELIAFRTSQRLYSRVSWLVAFVLLAFLHTPSSYAVSVKGKVIDIQGKTIELDMGTDNGIQASDTGRVYFMATIAGVKDPVPVYVANFKVTHPSAKSSIAKIEGQTTGEVQIGYLVELNVRKVPQQPPPKVEKKEPPTQMIVPKEAPPQQVVTKEPKPGEAWQDPHLDMEFVWVPGGCYEMGCGDWAGDCEDDEKPGHTVCVDGFWMGKYEVTLGQWKRLMGDNPSYFENCGDDCPVEKISWEDAVEFARRFSERTGYTFRLPTEAEWEYACRSGGKREKYSGGDDVDAVAWYGDNSGRQIHPVGQKGANGLGIYDMSGNVWEWCLDVYDEDYYGRSPKDNPQGPSQGADHVIRGGSWSDDTRGVRCAFRYWYGHFIQHYDIGFRLVRVNRQ